MPREDQKDPVADPGKQQARKAGRAVPKAKGKGLQILRKIKPPSLITREAEVFAKTEFSLHCSTLRARFTTTR